MTILKVFLKQECDVFVKHSICNMNVYNVITWQKKNILFLIYYVYWFVVYLVGLVNNVCTYVIIGKIWINTIDFTVTNYHMILLRVIGFLRIAFEKYIWMELISHWVDLCSIIHDVTRTRFCVVSSLCNGIDELHKIIPY